MKIVLDAGRWAREREWSEQDIEEAKLSGFQGLDAPESVSQEGMTRFLSGVDEDMEQLMRERLLDVNKEQVRDVADTWLVKGVEKASMTILGEKKEWVKESEGWTVKEVKGMGA